MRPQGHDLAQIHGILEIDVIHRRRHHIAVGVTAGRHCRHDVNQMHNMSTQQFPQRVGLRRKHHLCHFGCRRAHWLPFWSSLSSCAAVSIHRSPFLRSVTVSVGPLFHSHSFVLLAEGLAHLFGCYSPPRIIRDTTMTDQKKTRRQKLEEFLASNPNDAFSRYGTALECIREGDLPAAESHFRTLLQTNPDYVP